MHADSTNSVRCKSNGISGAREGDVRKTELMSLKQTNKNKNVKDLYIGTENVAKMYRTW
jgi:hypothetical protein